MRVKEVYGLKGSKDDGDGAVERTRTSTVLLPPAPQAGASASSATTAQWVTSHSNRGTKTSQPVGFASFASGPLAISEQRSDIRKQFFLGVPACCSSTGGRRPLI